MVGFFAIMAQAKASTDFQPFSVQNVLDANAVGIAILGMLIVFSALLLISCSIGLLPKLLELAGPLLPTVHHDHLPTAADQLPADKERIVAAIGYVLRAEMQRAERNK